MLGVYDDDFRFDAAVKFSECLRRLQQDDLVTRQDFINVASEAEFAPLFADSPGHDNGTDDNEAGVEIDDTTAVTQIFNTITLGQVLANTKRNPLTAQSSAVSCCCL